MTAIVPLGLKITLPLLGNGTATRLPRSPRGPPVPTDCAKTEVAKGMESRPTAKIVASALLILCACGYFPSAIDALESVHNPHQWGRVGGIRYDLPWQHFLRHGVNKEARISELICNLSLIVLNTQDHEVVLHICL